MLKKIGFAAALLVAGSVPALAQDACKAPTAPSSIDGSTATLDQVRAYAGLVKAFIADSDVYQSCIGDYVAAQKAAADKDKKPVDAALIQAEGDKVTANQASKQAAGDAYGVVVAAYKKAHP